MDREYTESQGPDLHSALKELLKKEVSLSRELLSNMRQEEVSLILHDQGSLNETLHQRSHLLQQLNALRLHKVETTQKIAELLTAPMEESHAIEIASLKDQLESITTRMTQELSCHTQYSSPDTAPLSILKISRPKKKTAVITLQVKR